MACMHMPNSRCTLKSPGTPLNVRHTYSKRPLMPLAPKASSQDSNVPCSDVARILQQHKLLIEHGFTYDQASLILQVSAGRRGPHQAGILEGSLQAAAPSAAAAAPVNLDATQAGDHDSATTAQEQDQQQQPNLRGIEDRLSFLEMELLKQSISVDAISSLAGAPAADHGTSNSNRLVRQGQVVASDAAGAAGADTMQLDPAVLAIAESLLIRQGRVVPALGSSSSSSHHGTADSSLHRQHQWQQQQQHHMGDTTTSSIWGRAYASRHQMGASSLRYPKQGFNAAGSIKHSAVGAHRVLPYGYLPDPDMVSSHDLELARDDDLVPYEPNGWSVAGTILLVYAGILLTFFAVIAGTAEGSGVDPDVMIMFW